MSNTEKEHPGKAVETVAWTLCFLEHSTFHKATSSWGNKEYRDRVKHTAVQILSGLRAIGFYPPEGKELGVFLGAPQRYGPKCHD